MDKLNILVVDDKPENLFTMRQLLEAEELDINVITVDSGIKALEKTLETDFSLILMDVQMPEMNGYETAELLRGSKRTKYIPIIFVTANSREEDNIFKGYESGAVDYLFKPINSNILLSKINVFLELDRQKKELDSKVRELEILKLKLEAQNCRLEKLTMEDGLTALGNRRCFDNTLKLEWYRSSRSAEPISLIMVDIDHFKLYNDTYGHQEGDICLKRVASALKSTLMRQCDVIARYGGEEFVLILPNTDINGATKVATRMLSSVSVLEIEHGSSPTKEYVTVSIGVATVVPTPDSEPEILVKSVDDALYDAKNSGRNRISVHSKETVMLS